MKSISPVRRSLGLLFTGVTAFHIFFGGQIANLFFAVFFFLRFRIFFSICHNVRDYEHVAGTTGRLFMFVTD